MDPDLPLELTPVTRIAARTEVAGARLIDATGPIDSSHARVLETRIETMTASEWALAGAALTDVVMDRVSASSLTATDSRWRTVDWHAGRVATLDAVRAVWDGVRVVGVRFDYANFASARLTDVLFVDCTFTTLDLPQATLHRVRFDGCRADEVDTRGLGVTTADLRGLDAAGFTDVAGLRGATLSDEQAAFHGRSFARAVGVDVR